jgi:hypothetical protein
VGRQRKLQRLNALLNSRIDLIDTPTTGLVDRLAVAEGDIVSLDGRTTTLEASAVSLQSGIDGNTSLINANATLISNQQTSITNLLSDLGVLQGEVDTNSAGVTANASSILDLQAQVGALDPDGGETWDFTATADGWTASNATLTTQATTIRIDQTGSDPQFIGPTISLTGGVYTQVVARVRQTVSGGGWDGRVHYTTAAHGFNNSYYKAIPDPNLPLTTWRTLTWDMTNLTAGGNDWQNSTITQIRLDFGTGTGGRYEVDWVSIAKFSTTAIADALDAIDVRVTSNEGDLAAQATRLTLLEATVDDPVTGVDATSSALTALTADVVTHGGHHRPGVDG